MQRWAPEQRLSKSVEVYPGPHALDLDDPQQHATLACKADACIYCMTPNKFRSCFTHAGARQERDLSTTHEIMQEAQAALDAAQGPRDKDVSIAKAHAHHVGLKWPPALPGSVNTHTRAPVYRTHPYKLSAFMRLHNVGLCVRPNSLQLTLQLIYTWLGQASYNRWLVRANAYVRQHVATWTCLQGRCKTGALSGVLRKKLGPPTVRSKSKYDIAHACRFFAMLVHETLLKMAREDTELANKARAAIKTLQHVGEFAHLVAKMSLLESERLLMDDIAKRLMAMAKTAFAHLKDFNLSNNWHKLLHAAMLAAWHGVFSGGTNDEHAEACQKLLHLAYEHFSNRSRDVIFQLIRFLSKYAAMRHAERWLTTANADLVMSAENGLTDNVAFLLGCSWPASCKGAPLLLCDPLNDDQTTGRPSGWDALAAASAKGHVEIVRLLLDFGVSVDSRARDGRSNLILAASMSGLAAQKCMATVRLLVERRANVSCTWSSMTAAEWAAREGNTAVAVMLRDVAGCRWRKDATPTPRMSPQIHRLRPPPNKGKGHHLIDLEQLRSTREGKRLVARCPPLHEGVLEHALRVFCNGGREDVPLAKNGSVLKYKLLASFEVQGLSMLGPDASAMTRTFVRAVGDYVVAHLANEPDFSIGVTLRADASMQDAATATVESTFVARAHAQELARLLSTSIAASAEALTQAFTSSGEVCLAQAKVASQSIDVELVCNFVPMLPRHSLQSIDVRPGILFQRPDCADDYEEEGVPMGYSAARLLNLERSITPAFDARKWPIGSTGAEHHFLLFHQAADDENVSLRQGGAYDLFAAELVLALRFETPTNGPVDCVLVRWLDVRRQSQIQLC